ncbi:hypothetical protein SKAU_G00419250 [Synaphobranchus kaupii]|uniref:Uncharacterized protein n=1 Tax=Synaphobranchus kaupii TaxID=118154 RepID=A0A9Q1IB04_SYNKA|nr:hypothetical protein SKAU_G00419250 [Synaphobranchus kaupii]
MTSWTFTIRSSSVISPMQSCGAPQGCFQYIESKLSLYTWAIGWYGFAVLMFVFFHLLIAMLYYVKL